MPPTTTLLTSLSIAAVALYTLVTASERGIDRLLALARAYDVPESVVGLTILAVGTSLPELSSHLVASLGILSGVLDLDTASAVVIGGNMGSSTAQQLLLLGVFLIAYGSFEVSPRFLRDSYAPMLLAFVATIAVVADGVVGRLDGVILLVLYAVYAGFTLTRREYTPTPPEAASENVGRDALVAALLLALVLASASLLLSVIETVVASLALGGSLVGIVTIGFASALPELTAVLTAVRQRAPNLAVGTLVGSNVVNPLLGIGLGGAISTYTVPPAVVLWDLPFKLLAGVALLAYVVVGQNRPLTRREGMYLVMAYFLFVSGRVLLFPGQ